VKIKDILPWAEKLLKIKNKIPRLDAEVLLSFVLNKSKEFLYTYPEIDLIHRQFAKFKKLIARRAQGEPVAYLIGHKEFFGLDFIVNQHVLIPRPETELMVEEVRKRIMNHESKIMGKKILLLDIGTGSGCIPIAILKTIKQGLNKNYFKKINCFATDIAKPALRVANHNAQRHKIKIIFFKGDMLSPILNSKFSILNSSLLITANLPYLTAAQIKQEPSLSYEPYRALNGGKEGLSLYKKFFRQIEKIYILNPKTSVFLEIDSSQARKITSLIKKILPQVQAEIKKDLGGKKRLVIISLSPLSK